MPSTSVRSLLIRTNMPLTATQRRHLTAKFSSIELHDLWMQSISENRSWVSPVDGYGERAIIVFPTQPGPSLIRNSVALSVTSFSRTRFDRSFYARTAGPSAFGNMSLLAPIAILGRLSGHHLTPPHDDTCVTPSPEAMSKLRRLHAAADDLAADAPVVLAHAEATRSLEQALIEAMIEYLRTGATQENRAAKKRHAAIMGRFHRVIEEHLDEPLYVPELCNEVATSARTLSVCCQEHLGMGPKRFLLFRRMHMARRALRDGTCADAIVSEIATRLGFWQLGRFAIEYKALFEESPSATLARAVTGKGLHHA